MYSTDLDQRLHPVLQAALWLWQLLGTDPNAKDEAIKAKAVEVQKSSPRITSHTSIIFISSSKINPTFPAHALTYVAYPAGRLQAADNINRCSPQHTPPWVLGMPGLATQ